MLALPFMKSMTGYGRGHVSDSHHAVTVEVSSVNRKQLEPAINLPRDLAMLEPRVREVIAARIARGRINIQISVAGLALDAAAEFIDWTAADRANGALRELASRYGLTGGIDLRDLLAMPGVLRAEEVSTDAEAVWPALEPALREALDQLVAMRAREGDDLRADLQNRADEIDAAVGRIGQLHPLTIEKYRAGLQERVRKAGLELDLDDERLAREVVLHAERCDISEELTRLQSHLGQFRENLTKSEPVGRTLEFIAQEIGRELNTLGAKANDAAISQLIVTCKAGMEKIREQLQNIE